MTPHIDIALRHPSQVGEARRAAVRLALELGLDETTCGRVAMVASELATNLIKHASAGRLLMGSHLGDGERRLEILSIDSGPGIADVARCLRDGYSTTGTAGTGLGAVERLSTDFSIFSVAGSGTVILSRTSVPAPTTTPRMPQRPAFSHAAICLAAPGETVSGDAWDIRVDADRATIIVADGLGHGPLAAEASAQAIAVFGAVRGAPSTVLERAHEALRPTRGAAVAIAEADLAGSTVTFAGAGNIAGRIISGVQDRVMMSQSGTIGDQIRRLQDVAHPWPEHAMVVLHSDGLQTRWSLDGLGGLLQCDPAVVAGWLLRDYSRGNDDLTVVVLKRA